jgi:hypothetical protein
MVINMSEMTSNNFVYRIPIECQSYKYSSGHKIGDNQSFNTIVIINRGASMSQRQQVLVYVVLAKTKNALDVTPSAFYDLLIAPS